MPAILLALVLTWTAPLYTQGSDLGAPAGCIECAVLFYPQKTGPAWWTIPTTCDTLAKLPASDGAVMSYIIPLWVGYGSTNVICRDAAINWSPPSNYEVSKKP